MTTRQHLKQTKGPYKTYFAGRAVKHFMAHRAGWLKRGLSLELANERALQSTFN